MQLWLEKQVSHVGSELFQLLTRMYAERLQDLLRKTWKQARKRFHYPELPAPQMVDMPVPWPAMSIKERRILVNTNFLRKYSGELPAVKLLDAILTHGLAHHAVCPWDLKTHISLFHESLKVAGNSALARFVTDIFLDAVVDYYCLQRGWTAIVPVMQKTASVNSHHTCILLELYSYAWKIALQDVPSSLLDSPTVEYLAEIDYLDRKNWTRSIRKVARALKAQGPNVTETRSYSAPLMGYHDIRGVTAREFSDSFCELAREIRDPQAFSDVFSSVTRAYGKTTGGDSKGKMGHGLGREVKASTFFYMSLAEKYRMRIRKMEVKKDGALYPYSHVQWSVSDSFYDIDLWNSMGKILPPLTVKWKKKEGEIYSSRERIPDCMVLIDSSGSMPEPSRVLSYAVLGACCAADAYLREDASVSVYNFSDAPAGNRKLVIDSRNRMEIYEAICTYFGGGTAIEIDVLEKVIKKKKLDIFLITDMEITNLEKLIKLFGTLRDIRVTAVYIGNKKGVGRFRKAAASMKHVSIYGIEKPRDIMHIVLGQLKEYLHKK